MTKDQFIELLRSDGRPIIRSVALMFEHSCGVDLCAPLAALVDECLAEQEQKADPKVASAITGLLRQFSLEVGLFSLMQGEIDRGATTLKLSCGKGNFLAGVALWVLDMRMHTKHLSNTEVEARVWEIIGGNKCHMAFEPLLDPNSNEGPQLWGHILAKLRGAFEIGVYVRGVLNLILGNHAAAFSDFAQMARETGKLPLLEDVAALQMWSGWREDALRNFRMVAHKQGENGNTEGYVVALESYLALTCGADDHSQLQ